MMVKRENWEDEVDKEDLDEGRVGDEAEKRQERDEEDVIPSTIPVPPLLQSIEHEVPSILLHEQIQYYHSENMRIST